MKYESTWSLITLEDEDGAKVYRFMMEQPEPSVVDRFTENVSIEWQYAAEGLPNDEARSALSAFEDFVAELDNPDQNSFLVFAYTGTGMREWSYYAKDYDRFLEDVNRLLAGKPRFPIDIVHSHDPDWEYWHGVKEAITDTE